MDGATIGAILAAGKSGGGVIASHARARQAAQDAQDARDRVTAATIPEIYALLGLGNLTTATASGPVAAFETNINLPIKDLQVGIEPVQTGSGDPSPENVRPITGWSGVKLQRTGKNLLSQKKYQYISTQVRIGGETANEAYITLKAGTYTLSVQANVSVKCYYTIAGRESMSIGANGGTFTLSEESRLVIYCYKSGGLNVDDVVSWQLELGSTATDYEPYQGSTYDLSFGDAGTVYGGTLDVISGELVVDRIGVDMGTLSWKTRATGSTMKSIYASLPEPYRGYPIDGSLSVTAERYTLVDFYAGSANDKIMQPDGKSIGLLYYSNASNPTGSTIYVRTTLEDEPAGLLVYELATPQTYHLTPLQVRTLIGPNNIWVDTGETAVTYYRKE